MCPRWPDVPQWRLIHPSLCPPEGRTRGEGTRLKEFTVRKSRNTNMNQALWSKTNQRNQPTNRSERGGTPPRGSVSFLLCCGRVAVEVAGGRSGCFTGHCGALTPGCVEVSGLWQKVRFLYSSSNMTVHHYNHNNHNNDNNNGHLRV